MLPTKLVYLEDFNLLVCEVKIVDILQENDKIILILDQTIFYPQGGGQPYDKGIIESISGKFIVEEVRFVDGVVRHIGKFDNGKFSKSEAIKCLVDKNRRQLNSRIHSAGHVIDMAINKLQLNWTPVKGFHFPEDPYVEYMGDIKEVDKEKLRAEIENLCNKLIQEERPTKLLFISKEEMKSVCHFVPDNIPADKPARVVMFGDFGVPCGGTHVNNLREIKSMTIRKIKADGENIRVAYDVIR